MYKKIMKDEPNSAATYPLTAKAETKSRNDFIKLSQILARAMKKTGFTHPDNVTEILILGMGGGGKSLIADSMIYEFFDYWDAGCIPIANKMCLEHRPVDASRSPVTITDVIAGIETDIYFSSNHKAISNYKRGIINKIEGVEKSKRPLVLFLSGILNPNDCLSSDLKIEIRKTRHVRHWSHVWDIKLETNKFRTPDMIETLRSVETTFPHPNFLRRPTPSKSLVI